VRPRRSLRSPTDTMHDPPPIPSNPVRIDPDGVLLRTYPNPAFRSLDALRPSQGLRIVGERDTLHREGEDGIGQPTDSPYVLYW
jgi:hypothetical protein